MKKFESFRCAECGDDVELLSGPHREHEYRRGVMLAVPPDFAIPTRPTCSEQYFTVERSEELAALQKPMFEKWQREHCSAVIASIQARHESLALRELEKLCGVSGTNPSHVQDGTKEAGDSAPARRRTRDRPPHIKRGV